ncbi:CotD family spore coat protein [Robertmurraya sp. DFI.2.37]|jgi:spore coat protein D|uniref:CotD family spore coat protein n=1 Tax=Robertmurraya sp. DFI.2.37 TaxID=3031819 RepID=UPI0023DB93DB|nr:CotD family spore coat protein [Robertmurraya sp. DFI.2.37]MDF1510070.1 CotD family spore coat protein [Robertmurraya sp. DFI.2.37]
MSRKKCGCENSHGNVQGDKTIVSPTETIVKVHTTQRTVRRIHPTEIINVNRTVVRNENFYPVTQRQVNEVVEENYDCGSDVNNPRCRRAGGMFSL